MKERVSLAYISNRLFRSRTVLSVLALILLSGCFGRSPDIRQFVLGASVSPVTKERSPETAVVVGPVRLPAYLERPQMARLKGGGEVALDDFARWLGGFEENFLRAISLGLARELGSDRIVEDPSKAPFSIDYQVRLHVDPHLA